jgi:AcrR family transcriptional regulator
MRSVARALGVPPMTIYGYVPNKEALDGLVIDRLLADVSIPRPNDGTWERRLHTLLCDVRRTLAERPPLAAAAAALGPGARQLLDHGAYGHEATRLADGVRDLLCEGGFSPAQVSTCFSALFTYVTGHAEPEPSTGSRASRRSSKSPPEASTYAVGLTALIEGLKLLMPTVPSARPG